MGLFDYVTGVPPFECGSCGRTLDPSKPADDPGFQTKSGWPMMQSVHFADVDEFHGRCPHCKAWIDFRLRRPRSITFDLYDQWVCERAGERAEKVEK